MKTLRCILVLALAVSSQSCFMPRSPEVPIPVSFYDVSEQETDTLVIFLPGRGDSPGVFESKGFIDAMKEFGVRADAVAADAHLGYYYAGQLADRIEADVLAPYRLEGYRTFILVGTSLGGYGSLWLQNEFPDAIDSVVLFAPFMGSEEAVESVRREESLGRWVAGLADEPTKDEFPWIWIQDLAESEGVPVQSVMIAFGEKDRFRPAAETVAELLPSSRVFRSPGGHDWETWLDLWRTILGSRAWAELSVPGES